ncbi:MAG: hypothetical protein FWC79_05345 [Oscillospiraceae bacterium]|nr:hypothetical protein [Oscillospiraceae bacterium]
MAKCRKKVCGQHICCNTCESKSSCEHACSVTSNWTCFVNWVAALLGK